MSAYFVITYDIANQKEYERYNPGSNHITAQTVAKHGGEIMVAGNECVQLSGDKRDMKVIITFPNSEAARAWDEDPDYAGAKVIRLNSTTNINAFIIDGLQPPDTP